MFLMAELKQNWFKQAHVGGTFRDRRYSDIIE